MVKYLTSRLFFFHEPEGVKVKPENVLSYHSESVIIRGLFYDIL